MTNPQPEESIDSETKPEDRIAWVEAQIVAKMTSWGPSTFQVLCNAIPVQRRNIGFALARLRKSGKVIRIETAASVFVGIKLFALAAPSGATQSPLQPLLGSSSGPKEVPPGSAQTQPPTPATKPKRRSRFVTDAAIDRDDTNCSACDQIGAGHGACAKHAQKARGSK